MLKVCRFVKVVVVTGQLSFSVSPINALGLVVLRYTHFFFFFFNKNAVFSSQAEYSYFSVDFRLKIFLN